MEYETRLYQIFDGSRRTAVKCLHGKCYILYTQFISGSLLIDSLEADGSTWSGEEIVVDPQKERGNMWLEGADNYIGTYGSWEEADHAADEYIENY